MMVALVRKGTVSNPGTWGMLGRVPVSNEDVLTLQLLLSYLNVVGSQEPCFPPIEVQVFPSVHVALLTGAETVHDAVLPSHHRGQINSHPSGPHAPAHSVAGVVCYLGASDHSLGRRAAGVDAGAA